MEVKDSEFNTRHGGINYKFAQHEYEESTRGGLACMLIITAAMYAGLWFTMLGATLKGAFLG